MHVIVSFMNIQLAAATNALRQQ